MPTDLKIVRCDSSGVIVERPWWWIAVTRKKFAKSFGNVIRQFVGTFRHPTPGSSPAIDIAC
jgi:hypothetical protein